VSVERISVVDIASVLTNLSDLYLLDKFVNLNDDR
jgi:hypothetical protein